MAKGSDAHVSVSTSPRMLVKLASRALETWALTIWLESQALPSTPRGPHLRRVALRGSTHILGHAVREVGDQRLGDLASEVEHLRQGEGSWSRKQRWTEWQHGQARRLPGL